MWCSIQETKVRVHTTRCGLMTALVFAVTPTLCSVFVGVFGKNVARVIDEACRRQERAAGADQAGVHAKQDRA